MLKYVSSCSLREKTVERACANQVGGTNQRCHRLNIWEVKALYHCSGVR